MEWDLGLMRASYESLLLSYGVWEVLLPYIIWGQHIVFLSLLLMATVGRRIRLRRKYVELLDKFFNFAAAKLGEKQQLEEEEEEEKDKKEGEEDSEDSVVICPEWPRAGSHHHEDSTRSFTLQEPLSYLAAGMRAVVQDCVTKSFTSAELRTWNMLSRTQHKEYLRMSRSVTVFWLVGVVIRYLFLFPMRILVLVISLTNLIILCSAVGLLPESNFKRRLNARVVTWCFDFVAGSLTVVARFHNSENRPTHGIAVANHTSPVDSMVLATDQCYDMVGQKTKGILGMFMTVLSKSSSHIWFERTDPNQRTETTRRLQDHARNTLLPPVLIFPEGTCVNNTALLQFKKGVFELDTIIYPIAIRFDARYGDAFWYQDTFLEYAFSMMTSWAIVCDVWYLPPVTRRTGESGMAFAQRVKTLIAHRGGFVQLPWDGFVKYLSLMYHSAKEEMWQKKKSQWKQKQQQEFAKHLSHEEHHHGEDGTNDAAEDGSSKSEEQDGGVHVVKQSNVDQGNQTDRPRQKSEQTEDDKNNEKDDQKMQTKAPQQQQRIEEIEEKKHVRR